VTTEKPYLVATNHYQLGDHKGAAPLDFLVTLSSKIRHFYITSRIDHTIRHKNKLSLEDIFSILSDQMLPKAIAVCNKSPIIETIGSTVTLPYSGRAFYCKGSPCEGNEFKQYSIQG
jgi:hypothetical protein